MTVSEVLSLQFQQNCPCFIMINTMNDNFNEYFYGFSQIQDIDQDKQQPFDQLDHQNSSLFHSFHSFQQYSSNLHSYENFQDKKLQPTNDISFTIAAQQCHHPQLVQELVDKIIFESKVIKQYQNAYQGTKNDTMELGINFKTLLIGYFRELQLLNELNSIEIIHIDQFQKRSPSFSSLIRFFKNTPENQGIRSRCLQLFGSSECIKRIMGSRCKMSTKLQMIKFIEKMRLNLLSKGKIVKWKDIIKKGTQ